jgi:hypothetical protein
MKWTNFRALALGAISCVLMATAIRPSRSESNNLFHPSSCTVAASNAPLSGFATAAAHCGEGASTAYVIVLIGYSRSTV